MEKVSCLVRYHFNLEKGHTRAGIYILQFQKDPLTIEDFSFLWGGELRVRGQKEAHRCHSLPCVCNQFKQQLNVKAGLSFLSFFVTGETHSTHLRETQGTPVFSAGTSPLGSIYQPPNSWVPGQWGPAVSPFQHVKAEG